MILSEEEVKSGVFRFSVDSALLGELGERLVSTVHLALSELVKNSYDADATNVIVKIVQDDSLGQKVMVQDDGLGMTLDQVRNYWMKIGTTNKIDFPRSARYGRLKTGSKGIGRFASRRLGLNLSLRTTSWIEEQSQFQTTKVEFDWTRFEAGIDVEEVECLGQTYVSDGPAGTTLEIWGGGRDEWGVGGVNFLKRQLAILASNSGASRPSYETDPGFKVSLDAQEFTGGVIDLREEIIDAGWGALSAYVDESGRAHCKLNALGLGGVKAITSREAFKSISGAKLKLGIIPARKDDVRDSSILSKYVIQSVIDEWGGVQVRFNGFRVFPYGDRRDDWLQIEYDRARRLAKPTDPELFDFAMSQPGLNPSRAMLNMLSSRNYVGFVEVSSEIEGLKPKIDRQGFIENDAFAELRTFVRFAIDWASIHRDYFVQMKQEQEAELARHALEPIIKQPISKDELLPVATKYLKSEIKRIVQNLPPDTKKETEHALFRTIYAIEARGEANQRQLEHLRLVASASTLTLLFAHEVRTIIGGLGATAARLDQISRNIDAALGVELNAVASNIRESKSRFDALIEMTSVVGAFPRNAKLEQLHLKSTIERSIKCFQLIVNNYGIIVDFDKVPGNFVVGPMVEGELYAVILNLLSNSIKSVIAAAPDERMIEFSAESRGGAVYLKILDNGVGLEEKHFEEVFTPFISDPEGELYEKLEVYSNAEDAHLFGTGTGLGLAIVRDIVRARKGDVKFISPIDPWAACVEVKLP